MGIADELNISHFQDHVQRQALGGFLQGLRRVFLLGAQGRNQTLIREPLEGSDVIRVPLDIDSVLATVFEIYDRLSGPLLLSTRDLAFAIEVPNRLRQQISHVGIFLHQRIPHIVDADNVTFATFRRTMHTQQADNIAIVGMEELTSRGAIDADLVNLGRVVADVLDVAEDVTTAVLREEVAEVSAETHIAHGSLMRAPSIGRETLK